MKTNKLLIPAVRQYRHNGGEGFVIAYDKKEVDELVCSLERKVARLEKMVEYGIGEKDLQQDV